MIGGRRPYDRRVAQGLIGGGLLLALGLAVRLAPAAGPQGDPDLLQMLQTRWGFDGTAVKSAFVPISIEIKNLSPRPWQGRLRLEMGANQGRPVILEQETSLQPDETRWLQFTPFVEDDNTSWHLAWGPGEKHRLSLPSPVLGPPATVLIYDEDAVSPSGGVLRRMPAGLFPLSVTGTDGLRGVIIDQTPFWQGARAQAFLDWVHRGGRVYLLRDGRGRFPVFDAPLQELNQNRDQFRLGEGTVRRIAASAGEMDIDQVRREIFNDDWAAAAAGRMPRETYRLDARGNPVGGTYWQGELDLYQALRPLVAFRRPWVLIYLTVLAYLAMLCPVCYRIGREVRDVRAFYGTFLGTAAIFSLIFGLLGQVGPNTRNKLRAAVCARQITDDVYDVTQWSRVAAVHGGIYSLTFPGSGQTFAIREDLEPAGGQFEVGRSAQATLRIPPAGNRLLLHRARLSMPGRRPQLASVSTEGTLLTQLQATIDGRYEGEVFRAAALYGGTIYWLKQTGMVLELDALKPREQLATFLAQPAPWRQMGSGPWPAARRLDELVPFDDYSSLFRPVLGNAVGLKDAIEPRRLKGGDLDTLRLAVLTRMPAEFLARNDAVPDQQGAVLFLYEYRVTGGP